MEAINITNQVRNSKPISNGLIGMVLLVITEIMFFAGLISAYLVNRAGVSVWPPSGQPRLPVEMTAVNTLVLMFSGIFFYLLAKNYIKNQKKSLKWLILAIVFALLFIGIQGYEWIQLLNFGLSSTSGVYGAFFYSIIGMHAFHILIGLGFLFYLWFKIRTNISPKEGHNKIKAVGVFWYFVVGIWPILYYMVYLM